MAAEAWPTSSSQSWTFAGSDGASDLQSAERDVLSDHDLETVALLDAQTTGEVHNLVPTGTIGAEWRAQTEHWAQDLKEVPTTEQASRITRSVRKFTDIRKLNIRESEQTLNVMCVGEAGMGKSTLVDSFFKTFREQADDSDRLAGEESRRVTEKKQALTRQENTLREAEKEMKRLKEEDKLSEAAEQQKKIARMREEAMQIKGEVERLRHEDQEQRAKLEAIKREISGLKQRKKQAKDADKLDEAQELKLELEAKEQEKKQLTSQLQRQGDSEREGDNRQNLDQQSGGQGHSLINGPTVEVTAKPPFFIKHRVADQPPVNLKVTLIDTPGYGDNTNLETTFKKIAQHVVDRFNEHRGSEEQAQRSLELSQSDPLVHCVLYFIAPHRLKPVDIAFMKELHEKVNLIPIIAKSDTMTSEEKRDFKVEVRDTLERHGINVFEFHKPTIDDMSRQAEVALEHPWAVIATKNAKVDEHGNIEAMRTYDWGNADAANPQHSDLLALQTLILGEAEAWRDLKTQTFAKYETWREAVISAERIADAARISAKRNADAAPWYERLRSRALGCYARVPPTYMMSLLVLLFVLIILPAASHSVHSYMGRADMMHSQILELQTQLQDMTALRDQHMARAKEWCRWYAQSKAWYLEPPADEHCKLERVVQRGGAKMVG